MIFKCPKPESLSNCEVTPKVGQVNNCEPLRLLISELLY